MKPYLTTRDCAKVIGVDPAYVRGEIRAGLLKAEVIQRPVSRNRTHSKPRIRIYPEQFREYLQQFWPRVVWNEECSM